MNAPTVGKIESGKPIIRLEKASERNGPISYYHIVVVPEDGSDKEPMEYTLAEVREILTIL